MIVSMDSEDELGQALVSVQLAVKYIKSKLQAKKMLTAVAPETKVTPEEQNELVELSPRETQVIHLMAQGHTTSELAGIMKISCETVKTHRKKIYRKLGVNKKSDCLKKARELGLLDE